MGKEEKFGKDEILSFKPGQTRIYTFSEPQKIRTARVRLTETLRYFKSEIAERGIERYETNADWEKCVLVVRAVAKTEA